MPGPPDAEDETAEEFGSILDVNLAAGFHLAARWSRRSPTARPRSIINISSVVGLVSTAPIGGASYAASKAGVLGLTRELAGQWGRRGIRVNAIVPGLVRHRDDRRAVQQRAVGRLGAPQHDARPRRP